MSHRRMLAYILRFPIALLLSLSAGAACAQSPPQTGAMTLGVAHSGVVQTINVADGEHVEAGHVLVMLDCGPLAKDIGARAASLQAAEANYERVLAGPRPEEIAIGEAGVGVAVARAEEARAALDRANAMQVGVSITLAQRLVAERDSRVADAMLMDARKKLALLKAGSRAEDVAEAKARRDQAAAFLEEGNAELDQCTVRAPVAGTVRVLVTLGQYVSTFAPTTLVQLKPDTK
jgi:multidrug efflux pump subunit AcrA (membrane-fusion protein)